MGETRGPAGEEAQGAVSGMNVLPLDFAMLLIERYPHPYSWPATAVKARGRSRRRTSSCSRR
jgi:hypothetical protein